MYAVLLENDFLLQITVLGYGMCTVALGKDASVCLPIQSVLTGWPCQKNRVRNLSEQTCGLTSITVTERSVTAEKGSIHKSDLKCDPWKTSDHVTVSDGLQDPHRQQLPHLIE